VRELLTALPLLAALVSAAPAQVPIPSPRGFVTDTAGVIDAQTRARLTRLLEELQQKTGAEIAVLTVDSTQPLDDFSYALQVVEAWKPGKKGEDTGVLVLVPVKDRKLRILVGYGLEGTLPDGLVGAIQDREMVPAFRAGRIGDGIWRGVSAMASRIAAERGVTLTGAPPPRPVARAQRPVPLWAIVLIVVVLLLIASRSGGGNRGALRRGRRGAGGPVFIPGGRNGGFGGFGGGGGGFGGFGGGGFGGGGAGRSW
jgi:uncharacterized protein